MPTLANRKLSLLADFNDPFGVFSESVRLDTEPVARRISFKATKTWKQEPNTCDVDIYNLSPDLQAALSRAKTPTIKLAAGYMGDDSLTQIFYGQAHWVSHELRGDTGDVVTTLSTTDGGEKKKTARINVSFGPNTRTSDVLRRIVKELGVKPGNLDQVARDLDAGIKSTIYAQGVVISGSAANELGHLCRSVGYNYSIQDGAIQLLKFGNSRDDFVVELNSSSGLIGSPSISNKGVVKGRCLIFKAGAGLDLVPGRRIHLKARFLEGAFILAKCDFSGDNYSDDWYCDFEAVGKKSDFRLVT